MKEKIKNILKTKNGVALVAVMAILLILTLYIPVMFSMGEISTKNSLFGTNQQRASYLARTDTEMAVAAFKSTYEKIDEYKEDGSITFNSDKNQYVSTNSLLSNYVNLANEYYKLFKARSKLSLTTSQIKMYMNKSTGEFKYWTQASVTDKYASDSANYKYIGYSDCTIKYDNTVTHYIAFNRKMILNANGEPLMNGTEYATELTETQAKSGNYYFAGDEGDVVSIEAVITEKNPSENASSKAVEIYTAMKAKVISMINSSETGTDKKCDYSVSITEKKNVIFTSVAYVAKGTSGEKKATRSCIVVLPTYPAEEQWLYFNGVGSSTNGYTTVTEGCNQLQFNPEKATGISSINYKDAGITSEGDSNSSTKEEYRPQAVQVYSCVGNMIINSKNVKDTNNNIVYNGINGSEFILGINPQLQTRPDNDPDFETIKGINAATYQNKVQKDNFIACTATNAIKIDLPVNLLVNGLRGNRVGDGLGLAKNYSIYKMLMLEAPIIYFSRSVDMMANLYVNLTSSDARRMSSVILMAPENTPYRYYNKTRQKTVKAGMVYFAEDCYLWVINFSNTGTAYSESWINFPQTVWKRDTDFVKVKIADAGDVYYFNSEVQMETSETVTGAFGIKKTVGSGKYVSSGLPLTGWALETLYFDNYSNYTKSSWWQVWSNTKNAIFGAYVKEFNGLKTDEHTYVDDDLHYVGNVYTDSSIEFPEVDSFHTVWQN